MLKETFIFLYEQGKSYEEIAKIMKITEGSVSGRITRYKRSNLINADSECIRNQNIQKNK